MPFDDSDIDPLLRAPDPALQLFRTATTAAATSFSNTLSFSQSNDSILTSPQVDCDESDADAEMPLGIDSSHTTTNIGTILPNNLPLNSQNRLAALVRTLKGIKKLKTKSEADLERYCTAINIEERGLLMYHLNLEIRDRLDDITSPSNWIMSDALKKHVTLYTKVFVLSSTTKSYKGNGPGHILQAMRELNVTDLPPEKEQLQVTEVLSFISDRLTSARNTVKNKIKDSMEVDGALSNVAHLANALIAKTPVKHTLQLYMRVAFLRWNMTTFGDSSEYWDKVDETLGKWISEAKSEQDLTVAFNRVFDLDKEKYGNPSDTDYDVIQPGNVEGWFKTIDKYAAAAQKANKKRKRAPA